MPHLKSTSNTIRGYRNCLLVRGQMLYCSRWVEKSKLWYSHGRNQLSSSALCSRTYSRSLFNSPTSSFSPFNTIRGYWHEHHQPSSSVLLGHYSSHSHHPTLSEDTHMDAINHHQHLCPCTWGGHYSSLHWSSLVGHIFQHSCILILTHVGHQPSQVNSMCPCT